MSAGPIASGLDQQGFMEEGEPLHRPAVVRSPRGISVSHLQEFGIAGFEIVDRLVRESLAVGSVDALDDGVTDFDGDARQRVKAAGVQLTTRF